MGPSRAARARYTEKANKTSQYTAASKSSSLDPTAKALSTLQALVAKDPKLQGVISAPTLTPEDKSAIVQELAKQAGAGGETVKNFLTTLAENNRLGLLNGVCEKFGVLMSAAKGEVEMTVTSAQVCGGRARVSKLPGLDLGMGRGIRKFY